MLFLVDIGNSNITFTLYQEHSFRKPARFMTATARTRDDYGLLLRSYFAREAVDLAPLEGVVITCVVASILADFTAAVRHDLALEPLIIDASLDAGIGLQTDHPDELGSDRLVAAAGAYSIYGGELLVIDAGTATTFDYLDADGNFRGGAIAPGIALFSQTLTTNIPRLPAVKLREPATVCGTNTMASMQAGIYFGYMGLCERIIAEFKKNGSAHLKIIITGGYGEFIHTHLDAKSQLDDLLIFKGLVTIYERNKG